MGHRYGTADPDPNGGEPEQSGGRPGGVGVEA